MDRFKRSIKQMLTRLLILSFVVVIGAIAIASSKKETTAVPEAEENPVEPTGFGLLQPAPRHQASKEDSPPLAMRIIADDQLSTASAEENLSEEWGSDKQPDSLVYVVEEDVVSEELAPLEAAEASALAGGTVGEETLENGAYEAGAYEAGAYEDDTFADSAYESGGYVPDDIDDGTFVQPELAEDVIDDTYVTDEVYAIEEAAEEPVESVGHEATLVAQNPFRGDAAGESRSPAPVQALGDEVLDPPPPINDADVADLGDGPLRPAPLANGFGGVEQQHSADATTTQAGSPRQENPAGRPNDAADAVDAPGEFGGAENPARVVQSQPIQSQPESAQPTHADTGRGRPGSQDLEGPQIPSMSVEKLGPSEVRVNTPAVFQIRVRNVGQSIADQVLIRDDIPEGTRLIETNPQATKAADGGLIWQMGSLRPGEEATVAMKVMPVSEGTIGSVATVTMQAQVSARARATKPELTIRHSAPRQVLVGDAVKFSIEIGNPGSGEATQVIVHEDVPAGLTHSAGPELEYEVGTIQPGETRALELTLKASEAGMVENLVVAHADGNLIAEHKIEVEVVAPKLEVAIKGPDKRFLSREATFTVSVANPGTADATNVELVVNLPRGMKFVRANNAYHYDPATHSIHWSLERLPAQEMGKVQFRAVPTQMGQFKINATSKADMDLAHSIDHGLDVDGVAALHFQLRDLTAAIGVGGETTYEIRVLNQGSKAANNLRLEALVPPGLEAIDANGPTRFAAHDNKLVFEPLDQLAPNDEKVYQIRVKGLQPGDQRLRVAMMSDDMKVPITKEESTHVYAD